MMVTVLRDHELLRAACRGCCSMPGEKEDAELFLYISLSARAELNEHHILRACVNLHGALYLRQVTGV